MIDKIEQNKNQKIAVCCIAKDEEDDIAEWISHHVNLGFDKIIIYDNLSTDRTNLIALAFKSVVDISIIMWNNRDDNYQNIAYLDAIRRFGSDFEWILFIDTDEFLVPTMQDWRIWIQEFDKTIGQILINWVSFGSSGCVNIPQGLLVDSFIHRAPDDEVGHIYTKPFIRPSLFSGHGDPKFFCNPHVFWTSGRTVNTFGDDCAWEYGQPPITNQKPNRTKIRIHHYWTKSLEQWERKVSRGYPDIPNRKIEEFYDFNERAIVEDRLATKYSSKIIGMILQIMHNTKNNDLLNIIKKRYGDEFLSAKLDDSDNNLKNEEKNDFNLKYYKFDHVIVACARWETPFIGEWLTYYKALGFSHVYLYCNDDDPAALKKEILPFFVGDDPFVTFVHHRGQGEQLQMYAHFLENFKREAKWVSFFDIDEYLRLPKETTIKNFVSYFGDHVDCIMFNWIFFGPSGHKAAPGKSIIEDYKFRQNSLHPFTKYMIKSDVLSGSKLFDPKDGHGYWHNPFGKIDSEILAVNVLAEDMKNYYDGFPEESYKFANDPVRQSNILSTAVLHHYAFRTEAAFFERAQRGLGGAFSGQSMWADLANGPNFQEFLDGLNQVEDKSLTGFWTDLLVRDYNQEKEAQLISRGKYVTQSSTSQWSRHIVPELDARGAIDGFPTGIAKFHTALEDSPWWMIDLEKIYGVTEIKIFNRVDQPGVAERASRLAVDSGLNSDSFVEIYRRETDDVFGGVNGKPLIIKFDIPVPARCVRVRLLERNFFHLDQVEIYGSRLLLELK